MRLYAVQPNTNRDSEMYGTALSMPRSGVILRAAEFLMRLFNT